MKKKVLLGLLATPLFALAIFGAFQLIEKIRFRSSDVRPPFATTDLSSQEEFELDKIATLLESPSLESCKRAFELYVSKYDKAMNNKNDTFVWQYRGKITDIADCFFKLKAEEHTLNACKFGLSKPDESLEGPIDCKIHDHLMSLLEIIEIRPQIHCLKMDALKGLLLQMAQKHDFSPLKEVRDEVLLELFTDFEGCSSSIKTLLEDISELSFPNEIQVETHLENPKSQDQSDLKANLSGFLNAEGKHFLLKLTFTGKDCFFLSNYSWQQSEN